MGLVSEFHPGRRKEIGHSSNHRCCGKFEQDWFSSNKEHHRGMFRVQIVIYDNGFIVYSDVHLSFFLLQMCCFILIYVLFILFY